MNDRLAEKYIDLLKNALVNTLHVEQEAQLLYAILCASHQEVPELERLTGMRENAALIGELLDLKARGDTLELKGLDSYGRAVVDESLRNHSEFAHTLIGLERLEHIHQCMQAIHAQGIAGDLLQAGCWRGGAAIFLRGVLEAFGDGQRTVWVADSFAGLPVSGAAADHGYEMDSGVLPFLSVPLAEVRQNFHRYGLLDEQVGFIPGWFRDSLADQPAGPLALLHVDADLYESTRQVLDHCHDRVASGGFVIVDDYGTLPPCREAVDEFISRRGLSVKPEPIGSHAACWRIP